MRSRDKRIVEARAALANHKKTCYYDHAEQKLDFLGLYIYSAMKVVRPDMEISGKAMTKMIYILGFIFDKLASINPDRPHRTSNNVIWQTEHGMEIDFARKRPGYLSSSDVNAAAMDLLSGKLRVHATNAAFQAVLKWNKSPENGKAHGTRAGLLFPVGRIIRAQVKSNFPMKIDTSTGVYLAGLLEYVCGEILELAGKEAIDAGKSLIYPKHIRTAVQSDEDLSKLEIKYMDNPLEWTQKQGISLGTAFGVGLSVVLVFGFIAGMVRRRVIGARAPEATQLVEEGQSIE